MLQILLIVPITTICSRELTQYRKRIVAKEAYNPLILQVEPCATMLTEQACFSVQIPSEEKLHVSRTYFCISWSCIFCMNIQILKNTIFKYLNIKVSKQQALCRTLRTADSAPRR